MGKSTPLVSKHSGHVQIWDFTTSSSKSFPFEYCLIHQTNVHLTWVSDGKWHGGYEDPRECFGTDHFAELAYDLTKLMARWFTSTFTNLALIFLVSFSGSFLQTYFVKNTDDKGLLVGKHGVWRCVTRSMCAGCGQQSKLFLGFPT